MINSIQNIQTYQKPRQTSKLSIFYYNDTHGNSDQMSGLVNSAKLFRKNLSQDTAHFVLSAGDNCSGGDVQKNSYIFDLMQNSMGVDASAVGNHEIDSTLKGFSEALSGKKLNFIATNVEIDDDHPIYGHLQKSQIKEHNGIKYGLIGAMPIDFKTCTKKEAQENIEVMDFDDSIEALQEEINNLKRQGVNKIILLSHSSYETDKKYAQNLDGVDVIVGGHSHSVVQGAKNGENIIYSKSGEPVIITQAGENGKFYGILNVEFDEFGRLIKINNELHPSQTRSKSPVLEYIKRQNLGDSPVIGNITKVDELPANRRKAPCAWTNLMADSMRAELNTDIAVINSANVRKVPQVGVLTKRDISESAPMKNNLIKTQITQSQLVSAISQAAKRTFTSPEGEPGLIQVSGLRYKIDTQGNLLSMSFVDKKGNQTPININNPSNQIIYSIACDSFITQANGEYPELAPQFPTQKFDFDKDETLARYIEKMPNNTNLIIDDDGRVEIQQTSHLKRQDNSMQRFLSLTCPKAS